jgi:diacylglycerol kinase family enzyme
MSVERATVILNRGSGRQNGDQAEAAIRSAFARHDIVAEFIHIDKSTTPQAATRRALAAESGIIAVAGGDGTISGVTSVMVGQDRSLGVIPQGTFNYFARSMEIPDDLEQAVDVIAGGHSRAVHVATINNQTFLNNASIGAYPAILKTREGIYRRWGRSRIAAYWSVLKALITFRTTLKLTIAVDGVERRIRTPLVFAVNNAFQLDQMGLDGQDCIARGDMVLLVAPDTYRLGLLRHAIALATGFARPETDYEMLCGKEIEIQIGRKKRSVARDGEISVMQGPYRLSRATAPLRIFVPEEAKEGVR